MAAPLSPKLDWSIANPLWSQALNPVLSNPINNVIILKNVPLIDGVTAINHGLGRTMLGWWIIDIQGAVSQMPYRSAPFNDKTLSLISNAAVTVSIGVF